jgi:hypothetical protein
MTASKNPKREPVAACPATASEAPTLRDQFAMAAMTGLVGTNPHSSWAANSFTILAHGAYLVADAMLEARTAERKA